MYLILKVPVGILECQNHGDPRPADPAWYRPWGILMRYQLHHHLETTDLQWPSLKIHVGDDQAPSSQLLKYTTI